MLLGSEDRLRYVQEGDKSTIFSTNTDGTPIWELNEQMMNNGGDANFTGMDQTAICRNHIMKSGKHYASFTLDGNVCYDMFYVWMGVIRPIDRAWTESRIVSLVGFNLWEEVFHKKFLKDKTDGWGDSDVHFCQYYPFQGTCLSGDWKAPHQETNQWVDGRGNMIENGKVGMLLDLDEGTLSLYINGEKKGVLKDGLSGEYCWMATLRAQCAVHTVVNRQQVSIKRMPLPGSSGNNESDRQNAQPAKSSRHPASSDIERIAAFERAMGW